MECSCFCSNDEPWPEVCRTRHPRARKEHLCSECGETITIGEQHEHVRGKWDGYWMEFRTCQVCQRIRNDFCPNVHGVLRETIQDCLGVDYVTGQIWGEEG